MPKKKVVASKRPRNSKKHPRRKIARTKKRAVVRTAKTVKNRTRKNVSRRAAKPTTRKRLSIRRRTIVASRDFPDIKKHLYKVRVPPERGRSRKERERFKRSIQSGLKRMRKDKTLEGNTYIGVILVDREGKYISKYIPGVGTRDDSEILRQAESAVLKLREGYKANAYRIVGVNLGTIRRETSKTARKRNKNKSR